MIRFLIPLLFLLSLSGCISVELGATGEDHVKASHADAQASCESLGRVEGFSPNGTIQSAETEARRAAAERGGNYFRVEAVDERTARVAGTAYYCLNR